MPSSVPSLPLLPLAAPRVRDRGRDPEKCERDTGPLDRLPNRRELDVPARRHDDHQVRCCAVGPGRAAGLPRWKVADVHENGDSDAINVEGKRWLRVGCAAERHAGYGQCVKLSPRYDGPAILSIDGQADDAGAAVRRQRRRLESLLTDLSEEEWRAASRCDAWSIQDVVAHLVGVNAFWEASVLAGLAGTPTRVLAAFDPAAHPPMMVEPMRTLTCTEVLDQFVASNDGFLAALAALDDHGWSMPAESPIGHISIRLLAHHALWDSWVHERDIAVPLGLTPAEEADEVELCLRYAAAVGPALAMDATSTFSGALSVIAVGPDVCFTIEVGESVAVRPDAAQADTPCLRGPAVELIDALSARAPLPADTPNEWHELARSLATMFDTELEAST
jgi:uncharacterized protein (TIGR03083 family)